MCQAILKIEGNGLRGYIAARDLKTLPVSAHLISSSSNGTLNIHVKEALDFRHFVPLEGLRSALSGLVEQSLRQATLCKCPVEGAPAKGPCKGKREAEWGRRGYSEWGSVEA